ncbi:hypothetical protein LCGC14_2758530 [marine sediment metagenome]|uniref:Uncharacterized protein n=1 Tax=marine sediment metagenome TaxID=412755 RepID=A0A0F9B8A6_9ZZZZ
MREGSRGLNGERGPELIGESLVRHSTPGERTNGAACLLLAGRRNPASTWNVQTLEVDMAPEDRKPIPC